MGEITFGTRHGSMTLQDFIVGEGAYAPSPPEPPRYDVELEYRARVVARDVAEPRPSGSARARRRTIQRRMQAARRVVHTLVVQGVELVLTGWR